MGNAASGTLPFKVSDKVEFDIPQGVCELLKAVRTDKDELPVSIFKYAKPSSRHAIALRHWHKLRVLKHPYVISYIDGVELDDSIMVVTEDTVPLKNYIKSRMSGSGEASITSEEVIWGLKCICQAISFLHANCSVIHGFLGLHAIFVSKNGDWKVGCFDLMSNPCQSEDELFFSSNEGILSDKYRSPERNNIKSLPTPLPVDVYSLGVLLQEVFSLTGFEVPADLDQLCRRMMMSEARRRPSLALILKSPCFAGERMQMMSTLDELLLKSNAEASEALAQFSTPESISPISVELCSFKLMPCVGRILTTALEEFQLRDSREAARQSIQNTLKLLSLLGGNGKLSEAPFSRTCLAQVTTLWTLSDRAVRTALLRTLPAIVAFIPATVVNGKVFDSLLNGFADNNLKMREDTLKSLVCLLDKLDEKNLQDKLVRCMCGLQADAEAAIRTNATIFLGRIAPKLKDAIKAKVLCSAYAKAIKDPFIHCRVAGLKAALSTLPMLVEVDYAQVVGKLLPQVCALLVDKGEETRRLALQFMDDLCVFVREKNKALARADEAAAAKAAKVAAAKKMAEGGGDGASKGPSDSEPVKGDGDSWGWAGWAVESLSKSLEQATSVAPGTETRSAEINIKKRDVPAVSTQVPKPAISGWGDDDDDVDDEMLSKPAGKPIAKTAAPPSKKSTAVAASKTKSPPGWGDDSDLGEDEEPIKALTKSVAKPVIVKQISGDNSGLASKPVTKPTNVTATGWGDEDDDDDFDDDDDEPVKPSQKPVVTSIKTSMAPKPTPKISSGWGDDDDDDDEDEPPKPSTRSSSSSIRPNVAPKAAPAKVVSYSDSWGDDDDDDDFEADNSTPAPKVTAPVSKASSKPAFKKPIEAKLDALDLDDEPVRQAGAQAPAGMNSKATIAKKPANKVEISKEVPKKSSVLKSAEEEVKKKPKEKAAVQKIAVSKDEGWGDDW